MTPLDHINQIADHIAQEYETMLLRYGSAYNNARNSFQNDLDAQMRLIALEARNAQSLFARVYSQVVRLNFETIAELAYQNASEVLNDNKIVLPENAAQHVQVTLNHVIDRTTAQMRRDEAATRAQLQEMSLMVQLYQRMHALSNSAARLKYLQDNKTEPTYQFTDRAGRRTPSARFVRAVHRQALLSVYNEVWLMRRVDLGYVDAQVLTYENGLVTKVEPLAIVDYPAVRDKLFHPNANRVVGVGVYDV